MDAATATSSPNAGQATGIIAKGEPPDGDDADINDAEAAAWYAAAAARGDEDEEEEEEEEEEEDGDGGGQAASQAPHTASEVAEDPYQAESDPYAASDPYVLADPYLEASAGAADASMSDTAQATAAPTVSVAPAIAPMEDSETGTEAASALRRPSAEEQPPQKAPRTQDSRQPPSSLQQAPAASLLAGTAPAPPPFAPSASALPAEAALSASEAKAAPADGANPTDPATRASPTTATTAPQPPPAPPMPAVSSASPLHAQAQAQPAQAQRAPSPDQAQPPPQLEETSGDGQQEADWGSAEDDVPEPPAPVEGDDGRPAIPADADLGDVPWDEKVIVVRQAQIHIELQHREPPMEDSTLLQFCDWLDEQLPLVVANFPYIRKSGAYVDLSDNVIGPEGLDKLFRVLRDHRVPCVVMKAYRNVLDDSIVDTLIEYLYTQPEAFPMHGIHISHNNITDKGAMRLIRAAAQCGHYPRLTSRLPLWLRLEANNITNPNKVVADCLEEKVNVCMMGDGLCSRPDCNHYSGVHVQLPYFFSQGRKGPGQHNSSAIAHSAREALSPPPPPPPMTGPQLQAVDADMYEADVPDWMRKGAGTSQIGPMVPAPKKQGAFGGPVPSQSQAYKLMGMSRIVRPSMAPQQPPLPPPPSRPSSWGGGDAAAGLASLGSSAKSAGAQPPRQSWGWSGGDGDAGGGCAGDRAGGWGKGNWGGGGKGSGKWGGGKGKGWGRRQMWQGPALDTKVKRDVKLSEGETSLGFEWVFIGGGKPPRVISVEMHSKMNESTQVGESLLRINGLDAAMFTEKQINDMLKQRPVALRFGDS